MIPIAACLCGSRGCTGSSAQSSPASEDAARTVKPLAPIDSVYPEGSWQHDNDHEAQSFALAMSHGGGLRIKPALSPGLPEGDARS
jgi:hypothetical protein